MSKPKKTKTEQVRAMLQRPQGASLEAICKATGWQPHSARALLSGFRKSGQTIERVPAESGNSGATIYRMAASPEDAK